MHKVCIIAYGKKRGRSEREKMRRFSRFAAIVISLAMLMSLSGAAAFSAEDVSVEKTITQLTEYFK